MPFHPHACTRSYLVSFTPFQIAFLSDWTLDNIPEWWFVFSLDRIVDVFFVVDIVLNFRTLAPHVIKKNNLQAHAAAMAAARRVRNGANAEADSDGKVKFDCRDVAVRYVRGVVQCGGCCNDRGCDYDCCCCCCCCCSLTTLAQEHKRGHYFPAYTPPPSAAAAADSNNNSDDDNTRYVRSWFVLDLVSSVPFEFVELFFRLADPVAYQTNAFFSVENGTWFKINKIIRLVRLAKLLKARVHSVSRSSAAAAVRWPLSSVIVRCCSLVVVVLLSSSSLCRRWW